MEAIELARKRPADAVLVLCDQDEDCAAVWGPDARRILEAILPGGCVMVVREYETWLLWNHIGPAGAERSPERIPSAKKALSRLVPGYSPTTHQLDETRKIDIERLRTCSASFDKLVRVLATICGQQASAAT